MPFWGGYGGSPLGFGLVFPLVGLLFMVAMAFLCFRVAGGMAGGGCMRGALVPVIFSAMPSASTNVHTGPAMM